MTHVVWSHTSASSLSTSPTRQLPYSLHNQCRCRSSTQSARTVAGIPSPTLPTKLPVRSPIGRRSPSLRPCSVCFLVPAWPLTCRSRTYAATRPHPHWLSHRAASPLPLEFATCGQGPAPTGSASKASHLSPLVTGHLAWSTRAPLVTPHRCPTTRWHHSTRPHCPDHPEGCAYLRQTLSDHLPPVDPPSLPVSLRHPLPCFSPL
jgi:hypothetical protein